MKIWLSWVLSVWGEYLSCDRSENKNECLCLWRWLNFTSGENFKTFIGLRVNLGLILLILTWLYMINLLVQVCFVSWAPWTNKSYGDRYIFIQLGQMTWWPTFVLEMWLLVHSDPAVTVKFLQIIYKRHKVRHESYVCYYGFINAS